MTRLSLSIAAPAGARADALVIGLYEGAGDDAGPVAADADLGAAVAACAVAGATGKAGSVTTIPGAGLASAERIVAVGLGKAAGDDADPEGAAERVRRAAGLASRSAAGWARIVTTLSRLDLRAAAEGHLLGAYQFGTYKEPKKAAVGAVVLSVASADKAAKAEVRRAEVTAEAVALARDLVNSAPNDLPPAEFADRAAAAAREAGLDVQVLDEKALARGGFGGILAVGSGSARPPRLVRVSYRPSGTVAASVALVGKGITFDSGGISIKPAAKMDQMTSDMAGAAAVIATAVAAARLGLPVAVTAYAALAENLPSGSAYRPGDVIRHYGGAAKRGTRKPAGKTSHILNTDAEGRLVLADAIVRAAEDDPDYLLETSTLTGAQIVVAGQAHDGRDGRAGAARPGRRARAGDRRGRLGDAAARAPARGAGLAARRPAEHRRGRPGRRNAGRRALSQRVRAGRPAVRAPGRGRPGLPRRQAVRLHVHRRHRGAGSHPAGRAGGPRRPLRRVALRRHRPSNRTNGAIAGPRGAVPAGGTTRGGAPGQSPRASRSARSCRIVCRRE